MTYQEPLSQKTIAISISESADMAVLGLAEEHLRDAMAEVAWHLLAMGARLVYGGDLRTHGFNELLFELVARHRRDADIGDERPGVISYLPWPVHLSQSVHEIQVLAKNLTGIAEVHCLDRQGRDIPIENLASEPRAATDEEWMDGLTAMRAVLTDIADARVVLGGRIIDFKGRMPGIAEETLTALLSGQPVFLIGGFGGCTRDIAEELRLLPPKTLPSAWPGREAFNGFNPSHLNNGLTEKENHILARTAHIDEAVALILRGLLRLTRLGSAVLTPHGRR